MNYQYLNLFIASICFYATTTQATSFVYQDDLVCNDPVTLNVESAGCVGASYCSLGDKLNVYGTVELAEVAPSSTLCLKSKACLNANTWLCTSRTDKVDICSDLELEGTNGEECPEAGEYKFDVSTNIPNFGGFNFGSGMLATCFFKLLIVVLTIY
jgi:hypothetical protein